jgi:hypothetical protein
VFLPVLFFVAAVCGAQDFDSAARELARKITAGRQDVTSLTVRNASSLSAAETADITRTLETELRVRASRPGLVVNVTLSENVKSYLWIADMRRGEEREVAMLTVERSPAPAPASAPVAIEKRLLWEQERPILDAAAVDSLVIVLDPASVALYRGRQLVQSLPIPNWNAMPRDLRGRLVIERDTFRAFLPGVICTGSFTGSAAMSCGESSAPWLLGGVAAELVPGKNYFTAPRLGSFFSSASLPKLQLVAGLDGRTRVYDGSSREVSTVNGFGSDIAAIESGCRTGAQVLATKPGDAGEPDSVQLFELTERQATPAGDPASFPGPVVALWPSARRGEAVAIARISETGRYAAYSLAILCDR